MKKTEALGAVFRMSGRGAGRAENLRLTANKEAKIAPLNVLSQVQAQEGKDG